MKSKMEMAIFCPRKWLLCKRKSDAPILVFLLVYICSGILFQSAQPFPHFFLFTPLFFLIGVVSVLSEKHYCREMSKLVLGTQMPSASRYFMETSGTSSFLFFLGPLITLLLFGSGGCFLFGALKWTATLVWMLTLFGVVVYISIIGYLQYIFLAIYIAKLSKHEERYDTDSKHDVGFVPADGTWIRRLTKLTHCYRSVFFTLGATYIVAFASFCYLPAMHANTNGFVFHALWLIIFLAIVIVFPVISLLERNWIKRIVEKQKMAYISNLQKEYKILSTADNSALPYLVKSICVRQILDSKDYPVLSPWSSGYAAVLSAANLFASIVTITVDGVSLTTFLPQIF